MIFPNLAYETVIQLEDKLRLDASKSFVSSDNVTDVLIKPELSGSFISIFDADSDKWSLDWAYTTDEMKTITVRIETDLPDSREVTYTINAISKDADSLFSSDSDLIGYEPDILNYLPKGKNSYLYAHRKAQDIIIAYLDEQRIWNKDNTRISKEQIASITDSEVVEQFRQWSLYQTFLVIFNSMQVSDNDIFEDKKKYYEDLRNGARNRSALRLDLDKDGELETSPYDIRTLKMSRR